MVDLAGRAERRGGSARLLVGGALGCPGEHFNVFRFDLSTMSNVSYGSAANVTISEYECTTLSKPDRRGLDATGPEMEDAHADAMDTGRPPPWRMKKIRYSPDLCIYVGAG